MNHFRFGFSNVFINMNGTRYDNLTVKQLKNILSEDGATNLSKCTKKELIERLCRREQNPQRHETLYEVEVVPAEAEFPFPDTDFQSVSSFPRAAFKLFTEDSIKEWFLRRKSKGSLKSGRKLAICKFVKCIECNRDNELGVTFVKALCAAQTTRSVDYTVKIAITKNNASICQASCHPCPAGAGWSVACKHVAAVGFNLEAFGLSGETMELVSKTSKPQRWHKPPSGRQVGFMKVDDIAKVKPAAAVVINPSRAEKLKCLLKAMEPSSPLFSAPNWYTPPEESNGSLSLECRTRGQADCQEWREMRQRMITGSMLYSVMRTVESGKFAEGPALRQIEPKDLSKVPAVKWGRKNECRALKAYEKVMAVKVKKCGLFQSEEWSYFGASPDGISEDGQTVIEVKCPYSMRFVKPSEVPYVPSSGKLSKKEYYAQVQAQMLVTNIKRCDFIVWTLKGILIQNVKFNSSYVKRLTSAMEIYYHRVFLPLLKARQVN